MRSIVRQLGARGIPDKTIHSTIVNEYENREQVAKSDGFDVPRLNVQDCIDIITEITGPNPATIVIDAVDEVQPETRHELVHALQQIVRDSGSVVKVFLTSRDDNHILALLPDVSKVRITATGSRFDMELFVHHQVSLAVSSRRLLGGDVSSELQHDLSQVLLDGAGEM